eukprot:392681_1
MATKDSISGIDDEDDFGEFLQGQDETTKSLLIEGIVKKYLQNQFIVPRDIVELICLFFGNAEHEKKTDWSANVHGDWIRTGAKNMFGDVTIGLGEIKVWKIKAIQKDRTFESFHTWMGIMDSSTIEKYGAHFYAEFYLSPNGYAFNLMNGQIANDASFDKYGVKCSVGDVITMELNMLYSKWCALSFKVNDIDYGVAYCDVDSNNRYRLALCMNTSDKIQLLQ